MCDGALSINLAKQIDEKYGVDVYYFRKDLVLELIQDCQALVATMEAEKLDVMPGNPDYDAIPYDDSDDGEDFFFEEDVNFDDDEEWEDDYTDDDFLDDELEDAQYSHFESPNT